MTPRSMVRNAKPFNDVTLNLPYAGQTQMDMDMYHWYSRGRSFGQSKIIMIGSGKTVQGAI